MIDWMLSFTAGLTFIALAVMGLTIVALIFMRWLNDNTTVTFEHLAERAENDIDQLRDEAVADLFDHARAARLGRQVGGDQ